MDWKYILLVFSHLLINWTPHGNAETVVQLNTKRWMYYLPERFLSMTIDPLTLAGASPLTQESFNMAKGLYPSFIRIGGISTKAIYFGKEFGVNNNTVSESQWDSVNHFAQRTGLNIIVSLNPTMKSGETWDPQNSLELISYSNRKNFDDVWQLGYDAMDYRSNGVELARDLSTLKKILDDNPKYSNLPVFGPDVSLVNGAKQIRFIKDLLTNAGNILGSIILQPAFSMGSDEEDPYEVIASMTNELDTYIWNKEVRVGRPLPRKPIWIAESSPSKGSFKEAIKLAKRLGAAAQLGVQVYLRQAGISTLKTPTPDFWFALLYKNLVGQGVLDSKIVSSNDTGLHVFSHCTASVPQERSILDADWNYEKGAVTVFGVNESPEAVKMSLKATNKEEFLHLYILTADTSNTPSSKQSVDTMFNGQQLQLSPTWDLPVLSPRVKRPNRSQTVILPAESIFFVVVPDAKVRSCSVTPLTTPDFNLSDLTKILRVTTAKKAEPLPEDNTFNDDSITGGVYVSFTKRKRHNVESESDSRRSEVGRTLMKTLMHKLAPRKVEELNPIPTDDEVPVKYITFNENSFLSKLVEGIREEGSGSNTNHKYEAISAAISNSNSTSPISFNSTRTAISDPTPELVGPSLSRLRRSSNEEPLPLYNSPQQKHLKDITESIKSNKAKDSNMEQVLTDFKCSELSDDRDKFRNARDITSEEASEEKSQKTEINDKLADKDSEEETKTTDLIKAVEETEKVQNVSDCREGMVLPSCISEQKLDEMMLETARTKSEAEPNEAPLKRDSEPVEAAGIPLPGDTEVKGTLIPHPLNSPHPMFISPGVASPLQTYPNQVVKPFPGLLNLPNINSGRIPQSYLINDQDSTPMILPNLNPMVVPPQPEPVYNEKREEAINNILSRMVKVEDSKLKHLPVEVIGADGIEKESEDLVPVNLPSNDTIMMAKSDAHILDEQKEEGGETLESSTQQLDPINEDDQPKVKVARQAFITPGPQTATLASPVLAQPTPKPPGPVSPIKTPLTRPSPDERLKVLQKRMEELRSQYLLTREKRLEEIKRQVAMARSAGTAGTEADQAIKNTIKRREAELKEWFKRFDKREAEVPNLSSASGNTDVPTTRPTRLSFFSNNDFESLMNEDLLNTFNQKRSTDISGPNQIQNAPQGVEPQPQTYSVNEMRDTMKKYLFPLDERTHGIVYNNKIYPAKLYGFIEGALVPGKPQSNHEDDTPTTGSSTRQPEPESGKIVIVPKDAFIQEMNSDFIPVVIVPPDHLYETPVNNESSTSRSKRSTLSSLEDQFHQIKEELLPKISSFVKNLAENPPWKKDLDRTGRQRRSVKDDLKVNELISLLHHPKLLHLKPNVEHRNVSAIEEEVIDKVDKAEHDLYNSVKEYTTLAERVSDRVLNSKSREEAPQNDIQYCKEVGTRTKSIIIDPFENIEHSATDQGSNNSSQPQERVYGLDKSSYENESELHTNLDDKKVDGGIKFMDAIFTSVIVDKFSQFLDSVKRLIGSSNEN